MSQQTSKSKEKGWEHSVAGGAAGSAAVLLLHPFDVIKTRLQVQDGYQGHVFGSYQGSIHAIRTIMQKEGWRAFYNGLVPAWLGSGVAWSAYFTAYEAIKSFHSKRLQPGERLSSFTHTISAAQAGALVCLLTNPIWLIKTRLQLQNTTLNVRSHSLTPQPPIPPSAQPPIPPTKPTLNPQPLQGLELPKTSAATPPFQAPPNVSGPGSTVRPPLPHGSNIAAGKQYKGFIDALVRIGKEEGLGGYYKGLGPSLILQTTHGAIQFTVYEELKLLIGKWGAPAAASSSQDSHHPSRQELTALQTSVAAALSKLTASVVTYPTQVVRSRLQQRFDLGRSRVYKNAWDVVVKTWQGEGVKGFYKGLGPALVRVLPQSALTLVVYEQVLRVIRAASVRQQEEQSHQNQQGHG